MHACGAQDMQTGNTSMSIKINKQVKLKNEQMDKLMADPALKSGRAMTGIYFSGLFPMDNG